MKRVLLMAMTALLLSIGATWAGPLEDGVAAHQRGDYANAFRIFQPLAAWGVAEAQSNLGSMYFQGQGVAQNYAEAFKWFRLAAEHGDAKARFNLGVMYARGQGVAQNYAEALKWYRLAAAQGNVAAQSNVGVMYVIGHGVAKDFIRAYMWFSLAAVSGDANAAKNRDNVAKQMTPQQIAEAQKMARDCQQRNFKGCD